MEYPFLWLFVVSLGSTLVAMPVTRRLGVRAGLLDHPEARKLQRAAVPRTGGIGVLVGLTTGTLLLMELSGQLGLPITRHIVALIVGGVLIHVTGVLDDLFDLPALAKLGAQSLAVGAVLSQGVLIERVVLPGGGVWELGLLAAPVTAFFLLGFINAINLVDGLDGLASGVAAVGAFALAVAGFVQGNFLLAALSTILLGSVMGFLPYNFRDEKVFLGDGGSMLLGYALGATAIAGARFSGESTALFVGVACALMPILDTVTTIVRRSRNGKKIFRPDSLHVHHRMVRAGLSPRRTVLTILALTLFVAGQAVVFLTGGARLMLAATALAAVLAGVQIFHRRRGADLAESDTGFREILFYLLGAQNGRGPVLDGKLAMAEVIAAVQEATEDTGGNGTRLAPAPAPVTVAASTADRSD